MISDANKAERKRIDTCDIDRNALSLLHQLMALFAWVARRLAEAPVDHSCGKEPPKCAAVPCVRLVSVVFS